MVTICTGSFKFRILGSRNFGDPWITYQQLKILSFKYIFNKDSIFLTELVASLEAQMDAIRSQFVQFMEQSKYAPRQTLISITINVSVNRREEDHLSKRATAGSSPRAISEASLESLGEASDSAGKVTASSRYSSTDGQNHSSTGSQPPSLFGAEPTRPNIEQSSSVSSQLPHTLPGGRRFKDMEDNIVPAQKVKKY